MARPACQGWVGFRVAFPGADGGVVSAPSGPDGPTRRRSFTPGQKLKYLSEYETARLRQQPAKAEQKLATTEMALSIMGKAHALLEQISKSADPDEPRKKR